MNNTVSNNYKLTSNENSYNNSHSQKKKGQYPPAQSPIAAFLSTIFGYIQLLPPGNKLCYNVLRKLNDWTSFNKLAK